jgi:hypothetical protein
MGYAIPPNVEKPPPREERVAIARLIVGQYGLITRDQARSLGMSDDAIYRRMSIGLWVREFPNVFRDVTVPGSWHQSSKALTLRRPGRAWVSLRAACAFWQLDGFDLSLVEVTTVCDLRTEEFRRPSRGRDGSQRRDAGRTHARYDRPPHLDRFGVGCRC